jgi:hypothetical protein
MLRCTQYGVLHIDDEVAIKPHLQHTVGMGNPSLDPIQANAGPHLMPLRGAGGDGACLGKVRQVRPGR